MNEAGYSEWKYQNGVQILWHMHGFRISCGVHVPEFSKSFMRNSNFHIKSQEGPKLVQIWLDEWGVEELVIASSRRERSRTLNVLPDQMKQMEALLLLTEISMQLAYNILHCRCVLKCVGSLPNLPHGSLSLTTRIVPLAMRGIAHSTRTEIIAHFTRMSHIRNSAPPTFYLIRMSHIRNSALSTFYFIRMSHIRNSSPPPLHPDVSHPEFCPANIQHSTQISHIRNSTRPTFHLLRISHIRNPVRRHSTFPGYLAFEILSSRRPTFFFILRVFSLGSKITFLIKFCYHFYFWQAIFTFPLFFKMCWNKQGIKFRNSEQWSYRIDSGKMKRVWWGPDIWDLIDLIIIHDWFILLYDMHEIILLIVHWPHFYDSALLVRGPGTHPLPFWSFFMHVFDSHMCMIDLSIHWFSYWLPRRLHFISRDPTLGT